MKKIAFVLFLAGTMVACSNDKKEDTAADTNMEESSVATADKTEVTPPSDGIVKIDLYGNDQMKFDKSEITVPAGSTVELTLTHTGTMPKETMGHNFVLLKPGTDLVKFTTDAGKAAANEYVPAGSDAVIASTPLIGGGQSTTITFAAPAPGTYDFICSFPGHYALMKGKLFVE